MLFGTSIGVVLAQYWCNTGVVLVQYLCGTGAVLVWYWCITGVNNIPAIAIQLVLHHHQQHANVFGWNDLP